MERNQSVYVAELQLQFEGCDTTCSGFLDREELTELCRRLQLQTHTQQLLDTLLQPHNYGRVNFEEFQQGLVVVLSGSVDFTSEDDSSYLEPAAPQEVRPQMAKASRRSHLNVCHTCGAAQTPADVPPATLRGVKLRRSKSLDSVKSFKSEVEQRRTAGGNQEEKEGGGGDQELRPRDTHLRLAQRVHQSISIQEFKEGVASSAPEACSTPAQSADLQRTSHMSQVTLEKEPWACSASPSLLTAPGGRRVLSWLDDGSGRTSPERVMILWTEEGIRNGGEILQVLDFSLDERLSLADLTLALDNELLLSGNAVHQAALISYRHEIQHLQDVFEAACRQRDKLKADLDQADHRNLELVREVDDRHASMETLNQCQIRELEQDFRERLTAERRRAEQESEALLQQTEGERAALQSELQLLRAQEAELKEDRSGAILENQQLHQELNNVKQQLLQEQNTTEKLHRDLQQLLYHKFGGLDPAGAAVGHEERFTEMVKEYELQCRELQDRNDELSSELELLKSQKKITGSTGADNTISWSGHKASTQLLHNTESDSDDFDMNCSPASVRKDLEPSNSNTVLPTGVSIQTELALEQLKQKHKEELQQLHIELETQVNFYERSLQLVRQSVEVERKDICQAFKLEISELEEQKGEVEQQVKQLKETVDRLLIQLQQGGGAGWSSEQERRLQLEQTELEQNFAREISNLVQQLSAEKEEQEAELKLKMDQEVQLVRTQLEEVRSENAALQERLHLLQQEVQTLEEDVEERRRRLQEVEREHHRSREEEERLQRENTMCREEVLDLSSRNLLLSDENAMLSARLHGDQEAIQMLQERLATVSKEQEEEEATVQRLRDTALQRERETLQLQVARTQDRQQLQGELGRCREQLARRCHLEAELSCATLKVCWLEDEKTKLLRETEERNKKVEQLQHNLVSMETHVELLHTQLNQEKLNHGQHVSELQSNLQEAESRVELLEMSVRKLEEDQASITLQETQQLRLQNQELQNQVQQLQRQQKVAQQEERREEVELLQLRVGEEQRRSQQLEEVLRLQSQQRDSQLSMKEGQFEKVLMALQQESEELQGKLRGVHLLLQEKVQQLKEELVKSSACSARLKDVYCENAQLMTALSVTERRQKQAEKKNLRLEEKMTALHQLLREVVMATLTI